MNIRNDYERLNASQDLMRFDLFVNFLKLKNLCHLWMNKGAYLKKRNNISESIFLKLFYVRPQMEDILLDKNL